MIEFKSVLSIDLEKLAANAREEEVAEVYASHKMGIYEAAERATTNSVYVYSAYNGNELLCLTGVAPYSLLGTVATPWLLTTNALKRSPRHLLRYTKELIEDWLEEWEVLENYVDARYEQSLRWAKWAGFTIHPAEPYGHLQLPFHRIEIRRP